MKRNHMNLGSLLLAAAVITAPAIALGQIEIKERDGTRNPQGGIATYERGADVSDTKDPYIIVCQTVLDYNLGTQETTCYADGNGFGPRDGKTDALYKGRVLPLTKFDPVMDCFIAEKRNLPGCIDFVTMEDAQKDAQRFGEEFNQGAHQARYNSIVETLFRQQRNMPVNSTAPDCPR